MKITVFVEGQSEMLFVADVLQKYSNYNPEELGFHCINLVADDFKSISFPTQGDIESRNFYQIINANNDSQVNTRLRKDSPRLKRSGYDVIIGLRDVYGDEYKRLTSNERRVDVDTINRLHHLQVAAINHPDIDCRLHYAIMEFESWMLALIENYITQKGLNPPELFNEYKIITEVEKNYHPFAQVQMIFKHCGDSYHKHESEIHTFLSTLTVDDYENLRSSGRCPSFTKFVNSLLGNVFPLLP